MFLRNHTGFQSLIGKLKTREYVELLGEALQFQSLIGKLKTLKQDFPVLFCIQSFNPL